MPNDIYDVAIIGAGVIGCSIAWELLNRGAKVIVCEEHLKPFQGSSGAGFGSLTPYSDPFFTGEAREFAAKSVDLYKSRWIEEIGRKFGEEIPFGDQGLIELFTTADELEKVKELIDELNSSGRQIAELLTVDKTRELEPNLSGEFAGAVWLDEPWLDKDVYFAALENLISNHPSGDFRSNTKILSVIPQGEIINLTTNSGINIRCHWAVLCTGLQPEGIEGLPIIPLKWIRGDAIGLYTRDNKPLLQRHVYMGNGFITPRRNGYMLLGATYKEEGGCPPEYVRLNRDRISLVQFKSLIEGNEKILPSISSCDIGHVWRGWRPTPKDNIPILGPLPNQPRIVIATGYIGLGITMAPATAKSIADYCLNGVDGFPQSFRPSRFI